MRYEVVKLCTEKLLTTVLKYYKIRKSSFDELVSELKQKKYPCLKPLNIYNIITILGGLI